MFTRFTFIKGSSLYTYSGVLCKGITRSVRISLPFSAIMEYTFYLTLGGITQFFQTGLVQIPTIILVGICDKVRCLFAFLEEKDILLLVVAQAIVR